MPERFTVVPPVGSGDLTQGWGALVRNQSLYESSWFSGARLFEINRLGIMSGFTGAPVFPPSGHLQVVLSMRSRERGALSKTFTENTGADATAVFDGPLTNYSNGIFGDFTIFLDLARPFVYRPERGNLLIDIQNLASDCYDFPYDIRISRSISAVQGVVTDPVGETNNGGLIMRVEGS
jgi:hypothetical protein